MKILFLVLSVLPVFAFGEIKIGTVEMMTLVRNHESYETNKKLLQDAEADYQKKLDSMKSEVDSIQEEGRKIADQAKNPSLGQAAKDKAEKELIDVQNRYIAAQQKLRAAAMESQQKLQEFESRLLRGTTDTIRKRIDAYAEKNGYDLIVEASLVAFAKKSFDVTDDLLRDMGVDPKTAKGRKESNESK